MTADVPIDETRSLIRKAQRSGTEPITFVARRLLKSAADGETAPLTIIKAAIWVGICWPSKPGVTR